MKRIFNALIIVPLAAGCTSVPPETGFVHTDGSRIPQSGSEQEKFLTDRTVCAGDTSKANLAGTVVTVGGDAIDAGIQGAQRVLDERRIMLGCMAGKGYKLLAGGQDVVGVPTFPVGTAASLN
jgi:hypothetical protein